LEEKDYNGALILQTNPADTML